MKFIHLNVHSSYSRGVGVDSIENYCFAARKCGMAGFALTDINGLYGMIKYIRSCKKYGLKPWIGADINDLNGRAVLLVKSSIGFQNLCRLISEKHRNKRFDLIMHLGRFREGLVVISDYYHLLEKLKNVHCKDIYVEISPGYDMSSCEKFSIRTGIPPVATNRVSFLSKEGHAFHKIINAIYKKEKLSRLKKSSFSLPENYFKSEMQMIKYFSHMPDAINNTLCISESLFQGWDYSKTVFPAFHTKRKSSIALYELALVGCKKRYGTITKEVLNRLDFEMEIIEDKEFSDYFLVVHDIVKQSSLTCGRGSAAASLVSYALEITHVDPIKHKLFFERFLNVFRKDPPDIDVDFAWDERDNILKYVFEKYSAERVAMVSNHVTLTPRLALREMGRVYGLSDDEMTKAFSSHSELEKARNSDPSWNLIFNELKKTSGQLRYLSVHCGGVVIVPDSISKHVPVEYTPKGLPVLQWDKDSVEDAGLVKIDLLGNRSLSVIRDALQMVHYNKKIEISYSDLNPSNDRETLKIFYNGDTFGVFYFESPATRLLLKKVGKSMSFEGYAKKDHFSLNTIITSVIRPASNKWIKEWVLRLRGKAWQPVHPLLDDVLFETLGIMVYQEQVSLSAVKLANFSAGLGEELRKTLSKKNENKKLEDLYSMFVKGARENGVEDEVIAKVWEMIASFAGYSFCKPHSASYTLVAYKSAWLRAHYPAEFMAAVISNQGGFYSIESYINEAKRMGLNVLSPDINLSLLKYWGKEKNIRIGFMQIQGLKKETVQNILNERRLRGSFLSLENFIQRVEIQIEQAKTLIHAGCFDLIYSQKKRPKLIWLSYKLLGCYRNKKQSTLFNSKLPSLSVLPYPKLYIYKQEVQKLGYALSLHPLDFYQKYITGFRNRVTASNIAKHKGRNVLIIGWLVTSKTVFTKHGEAMRFITFEDQTGIFETVLFPKVYQEFQKTSELKTPYVIKGKVEEDMDVYNINVLAIKPLVKSS